MRKIQVTGTALAVSPGITNGVTSWVPELEAYWLTVTGEATFTRAADTVTAARASELRSLISERSMDALDLKGVGYRYTADQWETQRGARIDEVIYTGLATNPPKYVRQNY